MSIIRIIQKIRKVGIDGHFSVVGCYDLEVAECSEKHYYEDKLCYKKDFKEKREWNWNFH